MSKAGHTIGSAMAVLLPAAACAAPASASPARHHHAARAARACANANTPAASAPTAAMRNSVVCLINQQRAAHGLPPVRQSSLLDRSAQLWTSVMVTTGDFWHGINFSARITAVGFVWRDAGVNIATGFPPQASVVRAWMV